MKRAYWMLIALVLLLLTGCNKQEEIEDSDFKIYYVNNDGTMLVGESYTPKQVEPSKLVEELIVALRQEPEDSSLKLAKPKEVNIMGYNFGEAKQLQLSFDENYSKVTGVEEVLMRAAIVKTFTQIDTVEEVEFYINGLPLSKGDTPIGRMQADDFIDSVGEMTTYTKTAVITLYFANESGDALIESQRKVEYDGSILLEQVVVEQLIDGPTKEEAGMKGTIPHGTVLNKISKKDGICSLDFNASFLDAREGIPPEITIYSIVNTLVEQPSIDKVQFTIDGETVENHKSIELDQLFERNLNLIEGDN